MKLAPIAEIKFLINTFNKYINISDR
jgi:hypothetical protein